MSIHEGVMRFGSLFSAPPDTATTEECGQCTWFVRGDGEGMKRFSAAGAMAQVTVRCFKSEGNKLEVFISGLSAADGPRWFPVADTTEESDGDPGKFPARKFFIRLGGGNLPADGTVVPAVMTVSTHGSQAVVDVRIA